MDVIKKYFEIEFTSLGKYIKRLDLFTVTEMSKHISSTIIVNDDY